MSTFLANLRLKYKFWLVNMVSFIAVMSIVLFALYREAADEQQLTADIEKAIITDISAMTAGMDGIALIDLIKKSESLFLIDQQKNFIHSNRLNISSGLKKSIQAINDQKAATFIENQGLFNFNPVHVVALTGHSSKLTLGTITQAPSIGSLFIQLAPQYAAVVLILMVALLAASQVLIVFVEKHVNTLKNAILKVQSQRDLTVRVPIESGDEIGEMSTAFNRMQESRQETMRTLKSAAEILEQTSSELAHTSRVTTDGMAAQQSETEQLVSAMTQMTAAAEEIAQRAIETHQISEDAAQRTTQGRTLVEDTQRAIVTLSNDIKSAAERIASLNANSQRIENATDEIRSIAEQTNLLALNAAIEAARAGESGRGFAVVADEVRKLAIHAQDATAQIQTVVNDIRTETDKINQSMSSSRDRASACVSSAEQAAIAIQEVDAIVDQVTEKNMLISAAAEEQSQTVETMNQNIRVISQASAETHQHAVAMGGHTQTIHEQAHTLFERVARMKVD